MTNTIDENNGMFTDIVILSGIGAIVVIALKYMDVYGNKSESQIETTESYYNIPILGTRTDIESVREDNAAELSPTTYLGYNTNDDLVQVLKRMPNGEVVRRKIRDPDMTLEELSVDRWTEYNDWNKEHEMDWI